MKIQAGCVVTREGEDFVVVESDKKTWTGKKAYGLVNLNTGVYTNLEMSMDSLEDLLRKADLEFACETVIDFYQ